MHDDIIAAGFQVVGVSPQGGASHTSFRERYQLPFTLITDTRKTIIRAYGVNGPMGFGVRRATFLIGEDGIVKKRVVSDFDVSAHTRFIKKNLP